MAAARGWRAADTSSAMPFGPGASHDKPGNQPESHRKSCLCLFFFELKNVLKTGGNWYHKIFEIAEDSYAGPLTVTCTVSWQK